jgi:hypothetical protein
MTHHVRALMIVLLLLIPIVARGQSRNFLIHNRGELWESMKDDGTIGPPDPRNTFEYFPSMDWPGGPSTLVTKDEQRSYSVGAGVWIGGKRGGALFFTQNGPLTPVDQSTLDPITKVQNFVGASGYNPDEAEEIITAGWTTTQQFRVKRVSRMWSFPAYNNFMLVEYTFTNAGASSATEVYFGFGALLRPSYQDVLAHNGWGDDQNRADELAAYDSTLKMIYTYDDTPNPTLLYDVGNYYASAAELRTPGYAGFALVSASPATGNRPQPATTLIAQLLGNERYFSSFSNPADSLYAMMTGASRSLQAAPGTRLAPFLLLSCGPYDVAPGASVTVVMAHAVNGIPLEAALLPMADGQALLPAGLDSLKASIGRARDVFAAGYRIGVIPPQAPPLTILPLPASKAIALTWPPIEKSYVNPRTGRKDIAEFRVYRATRSFIGPYSWYYSIDPHNPGYIQNNYEPELGVWKYIDSRIDLGVSYYYAVSSIDSNGVESWLTNRNETAVRAQSPPASDVANVRVFPNPFREVSGFPTAGEENSIVWTNLPAVCTIRIYTASGELIKTINHSSQTVGQEVWDQLTDARQTTAPGIYFWTVESSLGSTRGTLLLIK